MLNKCIYFLFVFLSIFNTSYAQQCQISPSGSYSLEPGVFSIPQRGSEGLSIAKRYLPINIQCTSPVAFEATLQIRPQIFSVVDQVNGRDALIFLMDGSFLPFRPTLGAYISISNRDLPQQNADIASFFRFIGGSFIFFSPLPSIRVPIGNSSFRYMIEIEYVIPSTIDLDEQIRNYSSTRFFDVRLRSSAFNTNNTPRFDVLISGSLGILYRGYSCTLKVPPIVKLPTVTAQSLDKFQNSLGTRFTTEVNCDERIPLRNYRIKFSDLNNANYNQTILTPNPASGGQSIARNVSFSIYRAENLSQPIFLNQFYNIDFPSNTSPTGKQTSILNWFVGYRKINQTSPISSGEVSANVLVIIEFL